MIERPAPGGRIRTLIFCRINPHRPCTGPKSTGFAAAALPLSYAGVPKRGAYAARGRASIIAENLTR